MASGYRDLNDYGMKTIFTCVFVGFGGFLFGYHSADNSGVIAMPNWLSIFGYAVVDEENTCALQRIYKGQAYCISSLNRSLITSFLSFGTLVGALSGSLVGDHCGRRGGILLASSISFLGGCMQVFFEQIPPLLCGRIIAGIGVGLTSMLVPMYQAEAAPPQIRGAIVSFYQLAITLGILVSQIVNYGTKDLQSTAAWRIPIGLQVLWSVMLFGGILFLPESPRHLFNQEKFEEGLRALATMRDRPVTSDLVANEYKEILANIEAEKLIGQGDFKECFKGNMRKRTLCGIMGQVFQQLTGINFILYYGTQFFIQEKVEHSFLKQIATGVVNCSMTIPGMYMVERFGRRKFLLGGAVWMAISQLVIGLSAVVVKDQDKSNGILVAFILIFIAGFASTWGCGVWVLVSELFPLRLRSKGMSLAIGSNWFLNWAISLTVPYLTDPGFLDLGSKIGFIWFGTCLVSVFWVYFYVPETSGWSLEELDEMFAAGIAYRLTPTWTPKSWSEEFDDPTTTLDEYLRGTTNSGTLEEYNKSATTVGTGDHQIQIVESP